MPENTENKSGSGETPQPRDPRLRKRPTKAVSKKAVAVAKIHLTRGQRA